MPGGFRRIAHRGASRRALENTLPAFRAALDAGAHWFEFDVWSSIDGHPVVFHDATLSRLASRPEVLGRMTWEQISQVRLTQGEAIPHFQEVVALLGAAGAMAYVEIKDPNPGAMEAVAAAGLPAPWLVSSFHHDQLAKARRLIPGVRTQALFKALPGPRNLACRLADEIGVSDQRTTRRCLEELSKWFSKPVMVYTVNDHAREETLRLWGAAGVYTDLW